jgi:hypothetical protein
LFNFEILIFVRPEKFFFHLNISADFSKLLKPFHPVLTLIKFSYCFRANFLALILASQFGTNLVTSFLGNPWANPTITALQLKQAGNCHKQKYKS